MTLDLAQQRQRALRRQRMATGAQALAQDAMQNQGDEADQCVPKLPSAEFDFSLQRKASSYLKVSSSSRSSSPIPSSAVPMKKWWSGSDAK